MKHQQDIAGSRMALLVLSARSKQIEDLDPIIPFVLAELLTIQPGQVVRVGG
jgi:hypothetical protein